MSSQFYLHSSLGPLVERTSGPTQKTLCPLRPVCTHFAGHLKRIDTHQEQDNQQTSVLSFDVRRRVGKIKNGDNPLCFRSLPLPVCSSFRLPSFFFLPSRLHPTREMGGRQDVRCREAEPGERRAARFFPEEVARRAPAPKRTAI